jgi:hypothetical protein
VRLRQRCEDSSPACCCTARVLQRAAAAACSASSCQCLPRTAAAAADAGVQQQLDRLQAHGALLPGASSPVLLRLHASQSTPVMLPKSSLPMDGE